MALRNWKRMREAGQQAVAPASEPNPWQEVPTLRELGSVPRTAQSERAEVYNDWVTRMRDKRAAEAAATAPVAEPEDTLSSFWDPSSLFSKSTDEAAPVDDVQAVALRSRDAALVHDLLAVLDLNEGATADDVGNAYRRLAKQHHPDQHLDADPAEQAFHATRMRQVISAYRALRQLEKV